MPSPTDGPADERADRPLPGRKREARANDTAVLAAAREVFATQGHGASMADVARHAGVGVGSVYRRYPTKDALVEALRVHGVREAARLAAEVADEVERTPREGADGGVGTFLARQITGATGPLLRPTGATGPLPADLAAATDDLRAGLERLVAHDRAAGVLPAGFTTADVMQLLLHLRPSLPFPRAEADALHLRYLGLVLSGLRARSGDGEPLGDGPRWDEWVGAWHD
ncbi:TetR/AcrR family transcriptional regulator [Krasilnikoviella flava]|uniref:Transcriptional regulator, TetR family n=1 Tax=Krasilnikoviella flava TaxID=526729 RepID=A0A1T5JKJ2_9MICO|nr:TetR/AcrR family transcriptional regulator [Krasilnikoviella flava]SKC51931.1 transcriptional regulator, TetR family [Krasilnikoviella flava]